METLMSETDTTGTVASSDSSKSPNLNIADLVNVLQVFRTCAQRGAFRADEMSSVGGLYDRLQDFLVATGAVKLTDGDGDPAQQPAATAAQ
jgi:hypothetical protein